MVFHHRKSGHPSCGTNIECTSPPTGAFSLNCFQCSANPQVDITDATALDVTWIPSRRSRRWAEWNTTNCSRNHRFPVLICSCQNTQSHSFHTERSKTKVHLILRLSSDVLLWHWLHSIPNLYLLNVQYDSKHWITATLGGSQVSFLLTRWSTFSIWTSQALARWLSPHPGHWHPLGLHLHSLQ